MPVGTVLAGLFMGFGLIIAIGAQNVFVLRQGVRREHIGLVIVICAISDAALIVAGVGSLGAVLERVPWFADAARWGGAAFLAVYGVLAARRAMFPRSAPLDDVARTSDPTGPESDVRTTTRLVPVALTTLALTWLNPHVYLDTVVLLGSVAATHGAARWWFALGATVASLGWFTALGLGARWLGRFLRTARAWRVLDGVVAVIMVALAVSLLAA